MSRIFKNILTTNLNPKRNIAMINVLDPTFLSGVVAGLGAAYVLFRRKTIDVHEKYNEENFEFPDTNDEYRLVIAIRSDLRMGKGKVAAQCGHASIGAYVKAAKEAPRALKTWLSFGGTKITVKIDSEEELLELEKNAKANNLLATVVRDAGQTQVAPGSRTVVAIGPAPKSLLDKVTGHLKLY